MAGEHYDICIIGSGAAGLSMALYLSRLSKKRVLVLEGSQVSQRQRCAGPQLELVRREMTARERDSCHRYQDPFAQKFYEGTVSQEVIDFDETFLTRSRVRVYGGTTNCWGGWTRTLQPIDFERGNLGGPWPIDRSELDKWYFEALYLCSLRGQPQKPNDFPLSAYDDASWWVGKTTDAIRPIAFYPGSPVRSGVLTVATNPNVVPDQGLDFQITWGPEIEKSANVTIRNNAFVRRIEHSNGRVTGVVGASLPPGGGLGVEFTITADTYVLAAGGIETARLMLLSKIPDASNTLGKGFMIHPVNDWPAPGAIFSPRNVPRDITTFYNGTKLVNASFPTPLQALIIPTDDILKANRIGNFRAMVNFDYGTVNFNWEQAPDDLNAITLSTTKKDYLGDPQVVLTWRLFPVDINTVRTAIKLVGEALTRLGYATNYEDNIDYNNPNFLMGDHPMGATRMAALPAKGVVDKNCRVFSLNNLYVASSSVFPTGGWSNPTLTIVALALRIADTIR